MSNMTFLWNFSDALEYIQKWLWTLARALQLQIGKFWVDSGIEISLFEDLQKSRYRDFRSTKNQLQYQRRFQRRFQEAIHDWSNRWRDKALRVSDGNMVDGLPPEFSVTFSLNSRKSCHQDCSWKKNQFEQRRFRRRFHRGSQTIKKFTHK